MERKVTTMGGNLITLQGPELKAGQRAPYFAVRNLDLFQVTLADFQGRIKFISVIPSLDTTVCEKQTQLVNQQAQIQAGQNIAFMSISMDLPFALKRWSLDQATLALDLFSDSIDASFGLAYGVLIKELRLLNRAIFIIDGADFIRYVQIVTENYDLPDLDQAFAVLKNLI